MEKTNLEDTQPVSVNNSKQPLNANPPISHHHRQRWQWILLVLFLLTGALTTGGLSGYRSGLQSNQELTTAQARTSLREQFELGVGDFEQGRFELARQRLEYVLVQDPTYPGLTNQLARLYEVLSATSTPTASPLPTPTITLTPTRDLRPVQDRFTQALTMFAVGDWNGVLEILISLRNEDSSYLMTKVDGLLYMALRNRGVDKIFKESNLEGGIYDLALAENFGPLDGESEAARNVARLYLIGSSFWEALPEQAVYWFSQAASAAPYLRDASGWTARERYRGALIQYGDQLANNGDWCKALEQYLLALAIRDDAALAALIARVNEGCNPNPPTPAGTVTTSPTSTASGLPPVITTQTPLATSTPTFTVAPPTPTETPTPPPPSTETPTPQPPLATDTQIP